MPQHNGHQLAKSLFLSIFVCFVAAFKAARCFGCCHCNMPRALPAQPCGLSGRPARSSLPGGADGGLTVSSSF